MRRLGAQDDPTFPVQLQTLVSPRLHLRRDAGQDSQAEEWRQSHLEKESQGSHSAGMKDRAWGRQAGSEARASGRGKAQTRAKGRHASSLHYSTRRSASVPRYLSAMGRWAEPRNPAVYFFSTGEN